MNLGFVRNNYNNKTPAKYRDIFRPEKVARKVTNFLKKTQNSIFIAIRAPRVVNFKKIEHSYAISM